MNDQEFIDDLMVRIRNQGLSARVAVAQRPFRDLVSWANALAREGLSMGSGSTYNRDVITARLPDIQRVSERIDAIFNSRPQMTYDAWLEYCSTSAGAGLARTAEYLASQLVTLRAVVAAGTFTDLRLQPGSITLRTTPVSIRHERQTYNMGIYELTVRPAIEVSLGDVHNAVNVTGGVRHRNYIHPHLGENGGCLGTGYEPLARMLMNQSWSDAFLLLDQLLRAYNPNSPLHEIEHWGAGQDCPECGDRVALPDEDADEEDRDADEASVMLDGRLYHERCTAMLSVNPPGAFTGTLLPRSATAICAMCGRVGMRENMYGRDGCDACRPFVMREREQALLGVTSCHNCDQTYDSDHIGEIIPLGRGDNACRSCARVDGVTVHFMRSTRWNAGELNPHQAAINGGQSLLRPNCATVTRTTPVTRRPEYVVCSCGTRGLSTDVSACKALTGSTRCSSCDSDRVGLSAAAQARPQVCLPIVTAWIDKYVPGHVLDFFDFVHPATVSSETLKRAVRSVLALNTPPGSSPIPPWRSVAALIDRVNRILGYPAIIASNELIGIYDSTYNRAQAVA